MVGARAMRAKGGMAVSAMAITRLVMLGPSMATTMSPRISEGKASSTSMVCIMMMSVRPPR